MQKEKQKTGMHAQTDSEVTASKKAPKNDWVCEPTQGPCKDKKPVYQSMGPQKQKPACPAAGSGWQEVTGKKTIKLNAKWRESKQIDKGGEWLRQFRDPPESV